MECHSRNKFCHFDSHFPISAKLPSEELPMSVSKIHWKCRFPLAGWFDICRVALSRGSPLIRSGNGPRVRVLPPVFVPPPSLSSHQALRLWIFLSSPILKTVTHASTICSSPREQTSRLKVSASFTFLLETALLLVQLVMAEISHCHAEHQSYSRNAAQS